MPLYNKFVVDRAFPWEEYNSLCAATFCSWHQFQVRTVPLYDTYCTVFTNRPSSSLCLSFVLLLSFFKRASEDR